MSRMERFTVERYPFPVMKILCLEPFYGGSHRAWIDGYARVSCHDIEILGLPPRKWKWRMRGAAITFMEMLQAEPREFDLLLASDFLNLADMKAFLQRMGVDRPAALYFHENQLNYPVAPGEEVDYHYGFTNLVSALVADRVFFNSKFHLDSFFEELNRFLRRLPDHRPRGETIERVREKSEVLSLGLDLRFFDDHKATAPPGPPIILWNHRWEHDKAPEVFFKVLFRLAEEGTPFRVIVCGEQYGESPVIFDEARERLGYRIIHFGYAESREEYARLLWSADVVVSTAIQEFFGASVAEAISCGCYPVLPNRLACPEMIPEQFHASCLYEGDRGLKNMLQNVLAGSVSVPRPLQERVQEFDWAVLGPIYDRRLAGVAHSGD
jgi:glycosyltransferase involved in cell wall biosynthesis